ncbi:MAG: ROK family protein, partial [Candidatus Limnocylindrales bacterium]
MMERAARPRADGRRPPFVPARGPVLALDLGASLIRAAVIDVDGRLTSRSESPTPVEAGPDAVVSACLDRLRDARAGAEHPVVAVGVSAPGPLDPRTGTLVDLPNMGAAFHDVELGARLADGLALPVAVDRDTRVALVAETAFGAA